VEKVNPDLVTCDARGEPYTVRYDAVNAMLLNEFLKEHRKVQEQEATIADLRSAMARQRKDFETAMAQQQKQLQALTASLKEQASQIQKVSAQIEVSTPTPQTVVDNR
jgi:septal ring factor EnvC (AmiA/AmiB activator)